MLHLYCITNKINGKKYVGITKQGADRRFRQHINDAKRYKTVLHNAIRKYGPESFSLEILCKARSYDELIRMEKETIESLSTMHPNGYNMTYGGDANWMLATPHAMAQRAKRQSISMKGVKKSLEHNRKVSEAKKGVPLSQKNLDSIRKKSSRPFICVDSGNLFNNGHEVLSWLKSIGYMSPSYSCIVQCCRGRRKTAYGMKWSYADGSTPDFIPKNNKEKSVFSPEIKGVVFSSVTEAANYISRNRNNKASTSSISKAASGKLKSAYGFTWEYMK